MRRRSISLFYVRLAIGAMRAPRGRKRGDLAISVAISEIFYLKGCTEGRRENQIHLIRIIHVGRTEITQAVLIRPSGIIREIRGRLPGHLLFQPPDGNPWSGADFREVVAAFSRGIVSRSGPSTCPTFGGTVLAYPCETSC